MDLSIVMPVYNEERRLFGSIKKIEKYFSQSKETFELIIVDDGSTDNTKNIMKDMKHKFISYNENRGKGYAVRQGVFASKGKKILITDADLSTPIREYEKLNAQYYLGYDICIGSRRIEGSRITKKQPIHRELLGRIFNIFFRVLFSMNNSDTQCGFKLMNSKRSKAIFEKCQVDGFAYDVEMLYLSKKSGLKIVDVPVIWNDSPKHSKIRIFMDSYRMLRDILYIRLKH